MERHNELSARHSCPTMTVQGCAGVGIFNFLSGNVFEQLQSVVDNSGLIL